MDAWPLNYWIRYRGNEKRGEGENYQTWRYRRILRAYPVIRREAVNYSIRGGALSGHNVTGRWMRRADTRGETWGRLGALGTTH